MEYIIVIHAADEGGYSAEAPALPGCFTQAESIEHLLKRAPEAIESHLIGLREDGQPIPDAPILLATVRSTQCASA